MIIFNLAVGEYTDLGEITERLTEFFKDSGIQIRVIPTVSTESIPEGTLTVVYDSSK